MCVGNILSIFVVIAFYPLIVKNLKILFNVFMFYNCYAYMYLFILRQLLNSVLVEMGQN